MIKILFCCHIGTNLTYKIQTGEMLVGNSSVNRGIIPKNITVSSEMVEQLGPGCHQLTLHASNGVKTQGVSTELRVCLLEPVEGLEASAIAGEGECHDSPDINIGVSLERGAPVQLIFSLTGDNDSFSETRDMLNGSLQVYNVSTTIEGKQTLKEYFDV